MHVHVHVHYIHTHTMELPIPTTASLIRYSYSNKLLAIHAADFGKIISKNSVF